MGYSREDCIKLVMLADENGIVLYKNVKETFPTSSSAFLYDWIGDSFNNKDLMDTRFLTGQVTNPMLFWLDCPMDYRDGYEFKPDDKFQLSVLGTDLRYEVKKEEEQAKISLETLRWAKFSTLLALIGILLAIWQLLKG
jgi:hypothetical protein